jgi:hypothetical protein
MKVLLEFLTMIRGGLIHPAMLQVVVLPVAEALGQAILVEINQNLLLGLEILHMAVDFQVVEIHRIILIVIYMVVIAPRKNRLPP